MLMGIKDFLAPTRGRIMLFVMIFVMIFLYDTVFQPFPGSPVVENLGTQQGAFSFVAYILVLPYILSCLLPAFAGLRKKKFLRMARLTEFMHPRPVMHAQSPGKQQHFAFPRGTPVEESDTRPAPQEAQPGAAQKESATVPKQPAKRPAPKQEAKPAKKASRKPAPQKGAKKGNQPAKKAASKKASKK